MFDQKGYVSTFRGLGGYPVRHQTKPLPCPPPLENLVNLFIGFKGGWVAVVLTGGGCIGRDDSTTPFEYIYSDIRNMQIGCVRTCK